MSRLPAGIGWETIGATGGHFLVDRPALVDGLLREVQQPLRLHRIGVDQGAVAQFPVGVVGQLDARPWRIELPPVARPYTRRPYFRSGAEAGELLRPTPDIGMGSVFRVHPCVYCQACCVSQIRPRWYGSV
jgi:hypothetical protein